LWITFGGLKLSKTFCKNTLGIRRLFKQAGGRTIQITSIKNNKKYKIITLKQHKSLTNSPEYAEI
jgi:hypothetical protein